MGELDLSGIPLFHFYLHPHRGLRRLSTKPAEYVDRFVGHYGRNHVDYDVYGRGWENVFEGNPLSGQETTDE